MGGKIIEEISGYRQHTTLKLESFKLCSALQLGDVHSTSGNTSVGITALCIELDSRAPPYDIVGVSDGSCRRFGSGSIVVIPFPGAIKIPDELLGHFSV
jgi:hypothetical protein